MNNKEEKLKIRTWAKSLRQTLDLKTISALIEAKVRNLSEYKSAMNVMSYLAKDIEISLNNLFEDNTKSWFLSAVGGVPEPRLLVVPYFTGRTKLIKNQFDILEPTISDDNFFDQLNKKIKLDVIFVPGLCFDKAGNRIGFGKGFYDRFLKLNPDSFKIGCCPKGCFVDKLPVDEWDEKVDLVVME